MFQTWFEALNSSILFAFNNARTKTTITAGLRKFVSTFNTRKVLLFSMASAKDNAVRSVSPTLVSDKTSKCSFSGNASNSCSNFSSEIFCELAWKDQLISKYYWQMADRNGWAFDMLLSVLWCCSNSARSIWDRLPWRVWLILRHLCCLADLVGRFSVHLILWCHPILNQLVGLCSATTHDIDLDSSLNGSQE